MAKFANPSLPCVATRSLSGEHQDCLPRACITVRWRGNSAGGVALMWDAEHEALYDEAVRRFGTRCLWSANPGRSPAGLRVIAARLKAYGGMDAWRLAERIEVLIGRPDG